MKVRLQQILSTPSGLVMGVQIQGPKDSWIRFATLEVPWNQVPRECMLDYYRWLDRDSRAEDLDESLPLDWG